MGIDISCEQRLDSSNPLPSYATDGAAGADLYAAERVELPPQCWRTVATGLHCAIPSGYVGQVCPRSGLARRHGVTLLNSPGIIDSDYRGEIQVVCINVSDALYTVNIGDRIAQLIIMPCIRANFITGSLTSTSRGTGGFGSTGR